MKRVNRLRNTRQWRPEITVEPVRMAYVVERHRRHALSTQREQEAEKRKAAEQALLMRWVRREMGRRLTRHERQMVELYYLEMMTLEEVAHRRKVHFSTVSRSLRRSVGKLRHAAHELAGEQPLRQAVLQAMTNEE